VPDVFLETIAEKRAVVPRREKGTGSVPQPLIAYPDI
jgi:hypothetical protein